jgi:transketolase
MQLRKAVRRDILDYAKRANVGHIGSALSVADIIAALYAAFFRDGALDKSRFILSKGHAALALYSTLVEVGFMDREELMCYCQDDSLLGTHPDYRIPGIEISTGSLGMGLGIGAGYALASKIKGDGFRTFVLMSDAECDEGVVWETAMFAAQKKLGNLIAIIDLNGQQALGMTKDILDLDPVGERWTSFGWEVHIVDGHNHPDLARVYQEVSKPSGKPHVIIAKTISGQGISFMEHKVQWHYLPLSEAQYRQAIEETEKKE